LSREIFYPGETKKGGGAGATFRNEKSATGEGTNLKAQTRIIFLLAHFAGGDWKESGPTTEGKGTKRIQRGSSSKLA